MRIVRINENEDRIRGQNASSKNNVCLHFCRLLFSLALCRLQVSDPRAGNAKDGFHVIKYHQVTVYFLWVGPSSCGCGFIAHNKKVSVQSQCKMHQENHRGIRFFASPTVEAEIRSVNENADNPCFCGTRLYFLGRSLSVFTRISLFYADDPHSLTSAPNLLVLTVLGGCFIKSLS